MHKKCIRISYDFFVGLFNECYWTLMHSTGIKPTEQSAMIICQKVYVTCGKQTVSICNPKRVCHTHLELYIFTFANNCDTFNWSPLHVILVVDACCPHVLK